MISLRYHVVSIAAAFLALAVGVVLGSTALSDALLSGLSDQKSELAERVTDLEAERNGLRARLADADAFAGSVGPSVVGGSLDQRSVVLVTTPRARDSDRAALTELIKKAGGSVTGEVRLTESFTDPARADQVRDIVTRLQPAGVRLPTETDPGTLAGALLGSVLLLDGDSAQPQSTPDERTAVLSGLAEGGFVKPGAQVWPAQLAVVLTSGTAAGQSGGDRATTLARFATQLDRAGAGTVLAGNADSARGSGAIGVARADTASSSVLSTVDNVNTSAGRVVTVLALREQLEGGAGGYGVAGNADAPAPGARQQGP